MKKENMPEVAFDEAGNTGADLVNSEQPVFSLASVTLSYAEAERLLSNIRTSQTGEIKFSRLKRSASGLRRVKEVLADPILTSENVVFSMYHKRFMIAAKIVDLLIEPMAHRSNMDLHKGGLSFSYSNMLYYALPAYLGPPKVDDLFAAFVSMFRLRTVESVSKFYDIVRGLFHGLEAEIAPLIAPVLLSEQIIGEILADNGSLSLDPAIPAFFQQCAVWGERFRGPFKLVHDESKPIFQDRETLESFMAPEEEGQKIGYDSRVFVFPIRAEGIRFARSQDDPRLQIADLVASASVSWAMGHGASGTQSSLAQELESSGISRFLIGGVWPSREIFPADLDVVTDDGVNPVSHMVEFLRKNKS
jgi:hypothetical protein